MDKIYYENLILINGHLNWSPKYLNKKKITLT